MKAVTIAHAGCHPDTVRKLEIVRDLAAGRGRKITIQFWQGTGADLAVVDPSDGFGLRVMELALRYQIPTLLVANDKDYDRSTVVKTRMISAKMSAFHFYESIEAALPEARREKVAAVHQDPFWETLTGQSEYLHICHAAHEVWVNRRDGYCIARTRRAASAISSAVNAAIEVEVNPVDKLPYLGVDERSSIEHFFFHALLGHQSLPDQKSFRFVLNSWPDIRCEQEDIAQAVTGLSANAMGQTCEASDLYDRVDPQVVGAFLMACRIADIAQTQAGEQGQGSAKTSADEREKGSGLVAALGRWLGLRSTQ